MRISAATVCAFASLFVKDLSQQAIAAPILPAVDKAPKAEAQTLPASPLKPVVAIATTEPPHIERSATAEVISQIDPADTHFPPLLPVPEADIPVVEVPEAEPSPPEAVAPPANLPEAVSDAQPAGAIASPIPPQAPLPQASSPQAPPPQNPPASIAPASVAVEGENAIEVPVPPAETGQPQSGGSSAPSPPVESPSGEIPPPAAPGQPPSGAMPSGAPSGSVLPAGTSPGGTPSTQGIDPALLDEFDPNPNPLQSPTVPAEVQTRKVVPITLEQALELARRNSLELRVAQLELERTQAALQEAQAANLPTVDVSADLSTQPSNQSSGGTDGILGGSIEVNYDVYTSGRRSAQIRASEGQVRAQALQVEVISQTIQLDVTNAYYDLQEADEQVNIAQAALEQAQRSLRDALALEQAGIGTRFDRLQTEVDVANSRQELVVALSRQQSVRRQIKRRLNINEAIGVSAADPVKMAGTWNSGLEDTIVLAYQNRAELEQQLVQREISQQQRRAALAELGPQVSVFTNYNTQNSLIQDNGFNDDYRLGARVRLRLFDGGAARARAAQEAANVAIAETRLADTRDQVRLEVEEAYLSLQSNLENAQMASQAVEAARTGLRLARLRFQAGVSTQADVSRLQTELTRAEGNRLQTILGYNRALASLQRAVSQIDEQTAATSTMTSNMQPLAARHGLSDF